MPSLEEIKKSTQSSSLNQKIYLAAALLITIIAIKYIASDLIAPILIAAMFAVLMMPIFYMYKRKGLSSGVSLFLMIFTIIFSVVGLIYVLQFAFKLIQDSIGVAFQELSTTISSNFQTGNEQLDQSLQQLLSPDVVMDILSKVAANFGSLFMFFIVIPVLAVLLVAQIDSLSDKFKKEIEESGPSMSKFKKFSDSMKSYIIGRFKVNLATASLVTLALVIMGIDYPLLWGLLTLILCFIPYLGIFIAGAGPFLLALGTGGASSGLFLIVIYIIITTITENIIDPMVQGSQNRLTTASIIIGVIFWSWLLGILGTIIAAPMTVMLKSVLEENKETKWIALLMMGDYSKTPKDAKSFGKVIGSVKNKIPGL